jgi:hypothetical protein
MVRERCEQLAEAVGGELEVARRALFDAKLWIACTAATLSVAWFAEYVQLPDASCPIVFALVSSDH